MREGEEMCGARDWQRAVEMREEGRVIESGDGEHVHVVSDFHKRHEMQRESVGKECESRINERAGRDVRK